MCGFSTYENGCGCGCEREREEGGIEMGKKERTRASNLCEMIYLEMGLL